MLRGCMAGSESILMYAIGGGFLLLTIIVLIFLFIIMKKVSDLEDANDGVLSKLNISQKRERRANNWLPQ